MAYLVAVDSGHGLETAGKWTPGLKADIKVGVFAPALAGAFLFLLFCVLLLDIYTLYVYNENVGGKEWKMKTADLIKLLEKNGWRFKRHGGCHDIYEKDGIQESIVRHRETDEMLARAIIRRRGLK